MKRLSLAERAQRYAALAKPERRNSQGPEERLLTAREFQIWREVWLYTAHGMAKTASVKDAIVVLSGYVNRESKNAWVSQKILAEVGNNISIRTLKWAIAKLRDEGYGLIERSAKGTNRFMPCLPDEAEAFARTVVGRLPYDQEGRAMAQEMVNLHLRTRPRHGATIIAPPGATPIAPPKGNTLAPQIPLSTSEKPLKKDSIFDLEDKEESKEVKKSLGEREPSLSATTFLKTECSGTEEEDNMDDTQKKKPADWDELSALLKGGQQDAIPPKKLVSPQKITEPGPEWAAALERATEH
jgi:hypothetical protein